MYSYGLCSYCLCRYGRYSYGPPLVGEVWGGKDLGMTDMDTRLEDVGAGRKKKSRADTVAYLVTYHRMLSAPVRTIEHNCTLSRTIRALLDTLRTIEHRRIALRTLATIAHGSWHCMLLRNRSAVLLALTMLPGGAVCLYWVDCTAKPDRPYCESSINRTSSPGPKLYHQLRSGSTGSHNQATSRFASKFIKLSSPLALAIISAGHPPRAQRSAQ